MKHISKIGITFENCEYIEIEPKYFMRFDLRNIETHINRGALNSIDKFDKTQSVALILLKAADKDYTPFGMTEKEAEWKTTIFKRLNNNSDITSFSITYSDGTTDDIYVDWDDDEYCNSYQKSKLTKCGDLLLVIDKDKGIEDLFDKDDLEMLDDEEEMEFYHNGWFEND